jgi:hypothetical protein
LLSLLRELGLEALGALSSLSFKSFSKRSLCLGVV